MIYGIGTDLVRLERFEQMFNRHGERLVRHLLMTEEIELFRASAQPARFFAMHWAAKEAIVKALGTGFAQGIWLRDTGYMPNDKGKPEIIWSTQGQSVCTRLGVGEGHLTLTDDQGLIVAMAVLMRA